MKASPGPIFVVSFLLAIMLSGCATGGREAVKKTKMPSAAAMRHLELARLYCSYKKPDYRKALKEFELYLSLSPSGAAAGETEDWIAVLRKLDGLRQQNGRLTKSNMKLRDTMKRLERLDMEMEREKKQTY